MRSKEGQKKQHTPRLKKKRMWSKSPFPKTEGCRRQNSQCFKGFITYHTLCLTLYMYLILITLQKSMAYLSNSF